MTPQPLFDIGGFLDSFGDAGPRESPAFEKGRKAWAGARGMEEPRCDFAPNRHALVFRGVAALTLFKRSEVGQTLSGIKADWENAPRIARDMAEFIRRILSANLAKADWCVVTPPPRRHTVRNFAQTVAALIAAELGIPFCPDSAVCRTKQRINAVYSPGRIPAQGNVIIFDDIITTGSTMSSMERLLAPLGKNTVCFAAINNKK